MKKFMKKAAAIVLAVALAVPVMGITASAAELVTGNETTTTDALTNLDYVITSSASSIVFGTADGVDNCIKLGAKRASAVFTFEDGASITNIVAKAHKSGSVSTSRGMKIKVAPTAPTSEADVSTGYSVYTKSGNDPSSGTTYETGMDLTDYLNDDGSLTVCVLYDSSGTDAVLESMSVTRITEGVWQYDVVFLAEDGSVVDTKKVFAGETTKAPEDQVKANALFYGWYDAEGNKFSSANAVSADATYTAAFYDIPTNYIEVGTDVSLVYTSDSIATNSWFDLKLNYVNNRGRYVVDAGEGQAIDLDAVHVFGAGDGEFQFWGSDKYDTAFETDGTTDNLTKLGYVGLKDGEWRSTTFDASSYRYIYMSLKYNDFRDKAYEIMLEGTVAEVAGNKVTIDGTEYEFTSGQIARVTSDVAGVWYVDGVAVAKGKTLVFTPEAGQVVTLDTTAELKSYGATSIDKENNKFVTAEIEAGTYDIILTATDNENDYVATVEDYVISEAAQYEFTIDGMKSGTTLKSVELVK